MVRWVVRGWHGGGWPYSDMPARKRKRVGIEIVPASDANDKSVSMGLGRKRSTKHACSTKHAWGQGQPVRWTVDGGGTSVVGARWY